MSDTPKGWKLVPVEPDGTMLDAGSRYMNGTYTDHLHAGDCYRHMVIGDLFPADSTFKHAGPLEFRLL